MSEVRLRNGSVADLVTETIDQRKAARWLRTSRGTMSTVKTRSYEARMRHGLFGDNGKVTIRGGFVTTGRHLLAAIANTGITHRVNVVRIHDPGSSHPELH